MIYDFFIIKLLCIERNYLPCFDSEAVGCVPNEGVIEHNLFDHPGGVVLPEATYAGKQRSNQHGTTE